MKSLPFVLFVVAAGCSAAAFFAYVLAGRISVEAPLEIDVESVRAGTQRSNERGSLEPRDRHSIIESTRSRIGSVQKWEASSSVDISQTEVGALIPDGSVSVNMNNQREWMSQRESEEAKIDQTRLAGPRQASNRTRTVATQRIVAAINGAEIPEGMKWGDNPGDSKKAKPTQQSTGSELVKPSVKAELRPSGPSDDHVAEVEAQNMRPSWRRGGFTPEQELHRAQVGWHNFAAEIFEDATSAVQSSAE